MIEAVSIHRDYDTISVSMINNCFAALALENHDKILARSQTIARGNLAILSDWVAEQPLIIWVKPKSGTTALSKYEVPMTSHDFCVDLLKETGVMFTPGSALDMEGFVRIGYANNPAILQKGLKRVGQYLLKYT